MREIKFRGLTKDGIWVYGDLIQTKTNSADGECLCWIKERTALGFGVKSTPTDSFTAVEPNTVGQYTDLKDENNTEVYEGDIVKVTQDNEFLLNHCVEWSKYDGCYPMPVNHSNYDILTMAWAENQECYEYEVIGNIHQNLELLDED